MNGNLEYLHTDGRGGFICGTYSGEITRKWHGWWVAENPPRGRRRILAGFDLRMTYEGKDYWLTKHWEKDRWVEADVEDSTIGEDFVLRGINHEEDGALLLSFYPAFNELGKEATLHIRLIYPIDQSSDGLLYADENSECILAADRRVETLHNVLLENEKDCEKVWTENLRREHVYSLELHEGFPIDVRIQCRHLAEVEGLAASGNIKQLRISSRWAWDKSALKFLIERLSLAADQFIVRGNDGSITILAGYPWFTDWGRDAMISIPGLCIATGRLAEAREIVQHFLAHMNQGLIPNIFPEQGDQPRYNTVDATLWLVDVVFRLWTMDDIAKDEELCGKLREIVEWHERGTHNNICVDAGDGLLIAGNEGAQITWMDVKVNGHVPTPRHGKPVEIQGLWFNALKLIGSLAEKIENDALATRCVDLAKRCSESFTKRFIAPEKTHLADVVDRDAAGTADWSLRPNMVIPFALHHNIIPAEKRADVLRATAAELLTPRGLRTLGPQEPKYHGIYRGDVIARDHAYHQGTVWMWLLGPYFAGVVAGKARVPELYAQLPSIAEGLIDHFDKEGCYGQCSEIFDGDPPHLPRGCFAQAWSTAALIQILQYDLD